MRKRRGAERRVFEVLVLVPNFLTSTGIAAPRSADSAERQSGVFARLTSLSFQADASTPAPPWLPTGRCCEWRALPDAELVAVLDRVNQNRQRNCGLFAADVAQAQRYDGFRCRDRPSPRAYRIASLSLGSTRQHVRLPAAPELESRLLAAILEQFVRCQHRPSAQCWPHRV